MAETKPSDTLDRETIEIVRDTTFSRFVADEALLTDLGRDLEVGFIQYGPVYTVQMDESDCEVTESRRVLTEVARMRMSYPAMVNFAMAFIRAGIESNKLKGDAILGSIQQWSDECEHAEVKEGKK